jgi:hypothetical protein
MSDDKKSEKLDILGMFGVTSKTQPKEGKKEAMGNKKIADKVQSIKDENTPENEGIYKAFSSNSSGQAQFEIRLRNNRGLFIYYPLISHAEYEGNESLSLIYQNTAYIIKGRNFQKMKNHYRTQTLEYIQEFDPKIFNEVPSPEQAFIEEIEIIEMNDG